MPGRNRALFAWALYHWGFMGFSADDLSSVDDVAAGLTDNGYLASPGLATAIFLSLTMGRPLFLEGEPGVGKTEVAKTLSKWTGGKLIRLQCYEGLDAGQAVYEWDYARQLLHLRATEIAGGDTAAVEDELYTDRFLVKRPILEAIASEDAVPPVLLVDEVDRADDEFEAFLLEVLADYAVTVPELGTFTAAQPPMVIVTSNRTRDVHDALKRRCLYHWVDHPSFEQEVAIISSRTEGVTETLARQVAAAVAQFRSAGLYKPPGVAESIDWAHALGRLGAEELTAETIEASIGAVLKYREDQVRINDLGINDLLEQALATAL